jgi:hypothetical protein
MCEGMDEQKWEAGKDEGHWQVKYERQAGEPRHEGDGWSVDWRVRVSVERAYGVWLGDGQLASAQHRRREDGGQGADWAKVAAIDWA